MTFRIPPHKSVFHRVMCSNHSFQFTLLCLFSLLIITIVCIIGTLQNYRPGLPTISRMLADDQNALPFLYTCAIIVVYTIRMYTMLRWSDSLNGIAIFAGFIQITSLLFVYVASLDYLYSAHVASACFVVGSTLLLHFTTVAFPRCDTSSTMLFFLYWFAVFQFVGLALTFLITTLSNVNERSSEIALVEYALFMTVPILQEFYVINLAKKKDNSLPGDWIGGCCQKIEL